MIRVAVWIWPTQPHGIDGDLDAYLDAWDEELLNGGVDPVAGRCAVGGEEDPVAERQLLEGLGVLHACGLGDQTNAGIGALRVPGREVGLELADVVLSGSYEARQVGGLDGVVVDEDERANPQAGKFFDEDAADTAQADDCNAEPVQRRLPDVAQEPGLPIVARPGGCDSDRTGSEAQQIASRDHGLGQECAAAVGKPEVPRSGLWGKDEPTDRLSGDLPQGRIPTLMARGVDGGEANPIQPPWAWTAR